MATRGHLRPWLHSAASCTLKPLQRLPSWSQLAGVADANLRWPILRDRRTPSVPPSKDPPAQAGPPSQHFASRQRGSCVHMPTKAWRLLRVMWSERHLHKACWGTQGGRTAPGSGAFATGVVRATPRTRHPASTLTHTTPRNQAPALMCTLLVSRTQIEIIKGLPADAVITIYRVGPMVDLCSGPHLPNTALLKVGAPPALPRSSCTHTHWFFPVLHKTSVFTGPVREREARGQRTEREPVVVSAMACVARPDHVATTNRSSGAAESSFICHLPSPISQLSCGSMMAGLVHACRCDSIVRICQTPCLAPCARPWTALGSCQRRPGVHMSTKVRCLLCVMWSERHLRKACCCCRRRRLSWSRPPQPHGGCRVVAVTPTALSSVHPTGSRCHRRLPCLLAC